MRPFQLLPGTPGLCRPPEAGLGCVKRIFRCLPETRMALNLHDGRMAKTGFAISPSGCYRCYEGMEGWELEPPGRCTTMTLACYRYEGRKPQDVEQAPRVHNARGCFYRAAAICY